MHQGFVQNQARARNLQDVSVLPDLCTSHRRQLGVMLKNHQTLQDIHRRCAAAKDELSANLHTRLRYNGVNIDESTAVCNHFHRHTATRMPYWTTQCYLEEVTFPSLPQLILDLATPERMRVDLFS